MLINGSTPGEPSAATADLGRVFEVFWQWAAPEAPTSHADYYSEAFQAWLTLPPWDMFAHAPGKSRDPSVAPFDISGALSALTSITQPQGLCASNASATSTSTASAFVSASPGALHTSTPTCRSHV